MEDDDDEEEVVEFEEFVRCALLRGISIRVTSSLIESSPSPPLVELHLGGCKLGGDATAVIGIAILGLIISLCDHLSHKVHSRPAMIFGLESHAGETSAAAGYAGGTGRLWSAVDCLMRVRIKKDRTW